MTGTPVTVAEVLEARDRRCELQRALREKHGLPVISFTMNLAGEIKRLPQADLAFSDALRQLRERLGEPIEQRILDENTGMEALLVYDRDEGELKDICMEPENTPVGRLYDMDVIGRDGKKLSRSAERSCLVCGGPVRECARSRAHGLAAVKAKTAELLRENTAELLGSRAVEALQREAMLTPKPGLVDARDSGSHEDMDLALMLKSAASLRGYFQEAARLGMDSPDCMDELKRAGIRAEKAMFAATNGVNTHKGAVYALGLLTAALGSCALRGGDPFLIASALARAGENLQPGSHGDTVRKRYGSSGIVAEAKNGFPSVQRGLRELEDSGSPLRALLQIILVCEDTTLLYRGGAEGLAFTRQWAREALSMEENAMIACLEEMNTEMTRRHLSPGGCADMLAAALLMQSAGTLYH